MESSLNITNEDFIIKNNHQSLFDDDVSRIQKNHHNSDNLGRSSFSGWTPPPNLTDISDQYQKNLIQLVSNQNYDPLNQNCVTTQNYPVYNLSTSEIPSKDPISSINSYSGYDTFGESMDNMTNTNQNNMPCGNAMWDNTTHNKGCITSGYQPVYNNITIESHPFDLPVDEGIKSPTREITNWRQDQILVKMNQKVVTKCKPLRKVNVIKEKWTDEEDKQLVENVELYGTKWGTIAKMFKGRKGKQCRERWYNHLCPNIKKGDWTAEEDERLVAAHKIFGNKWVDIAEQLPGRSENTIKNHWNTTKRRVHLMKTKGGGENANPPRNILENYIIHVVINNAPPKTFGITYTKDDYDYESISDGEMNLSMNDTTKTTERLVDASTSSDYVSEPTVFSWENYFTKVCESMDETHKLMQGWE
ncbi:unnamed protein product [Arabis nemorensis]|uniref:Uncharacterized protein n=1 Tax=Arabis nemorensis TaxID=586526 RepID=A0A565C748_9BRAS|nr:unnamed protein product [Arabis nemorensis]